MAGNKTGRMMKKGEKKVEKIVTEKKKRSSGRKVGEVGMERKTNEEKGFELPTAEVYKVRKGKNGMRRARAGSGEEQERDMQNVRHCTLIRI